MVLNNEPMAAYSKPNFATNWDCADRIKMECYGGLMRVKSVRLTPLVSNYNPPAPAIFNYTFTGYDENNAVYVVETVNLDITTMKRAKRVRFGNKFKSVCSVTFEADGNEAFGVDDVKVKIRAKKPCLDKTKDQY